MSFTEGLIRAHIEAYGYFDIKLTGHCMEPLLRKGDRARIAQALRLCTGDMVLARYGGGRLLFHRVVGVGHRSALLKGDFSGSCEEVAIENILGVSSCFSIAGGDWVADVRDKRELSRLLELSLMLCRKESLGIAQETRREIWSLNSNARKQMILAGNRGRSLIPGDEGPGYGSGFYEPK